MATNAELIEQAIANQLALLLTDSLTPKLDYSIDGQSVSRSAWRASRLAALKELYNLRQFEDPFESRTYAV